LGLLKNFLKAANFIILVKEIFSFATWASVVAHLVGSKYGITMRAIERCIERRMGSWWYLDLNLKPTFYLGC
jgi:hypothetical protein